MFYECFGDFDKFFFQIIRAKKQSSQLLLYFYVYFELISKKQKKYQNSKSYDSTKIEKILKTKISKN